MYLLSSSDISRWFARQKKNNLPGRELQSFVFTDHRQQARLEQLSSYLGTLNFTGGPVVYDGDGEAYITVHPPSAMDEDSLLSMNSSLRQLAGKYGVKYLGLEVADELDRNQGQLRHQRRISESSPSIARNSKAKAAALQQAAYGPDTHCSKPPKRQPASPMSGWPLAVSGLCLVAFGWWLLCGQIASTKEYQSQKEWIVAQGLLQEVGIGYHWGSRASTFEMLARYTFQVNGRDLEGTWIDGRHWSGYLYGVQNLVAEFVPEAANLKKQDFSFGESKKIWRLPFPGVPVQVRYDPADPARARLVLKNPLPSEVAHPVLIWGISIAIMLLGAAGVAIFVAGFFLRDEQDH